MNDWMIEAFIIAAIVLFFITVILMINIINKYRNYDECNGTIIDFHENPSIMRIGFEDGMKGISPIISYSVNGKSYKFIGNYCTTAMKVGDPITVLYNKKDCSKAKIKKGLFLAPFITGVLTLFFILFIIVYVNLEMI